jgi:hypothetical protein
MGSQRTGHCQRLHVEARARITNPNPEREFVERRGGSQRASENRILKALKKMKEEWHTYHDISTTPITKIAESWVRIRETILNVKNPSKRNRYPRLG